MTKKYILFSLFCTILVVQNLFSKMSLPKKEIIFEKFFIRLFHLSLSSETKFQKSLDFSCPLHFILFLTTYDTLTHKRCFSTTPLNNKYLSIAEYLFTNKFPSIKRFCSNICPINKDSYQIVRNTISIGTFFYDVFSEYYWWQKKQDLRKIFSEKLKKDANSLEEIKEYIESIKNLQGFEYLEKLRKKPNFVTAGGKAISNEIEKLNLFFTLFFNKNYFLRAMIKSIIKKKDPKEKYLHPVARWFLLPAFFISLLFKKPRNFVKNIALSSQ